MIASVDRKNYRRMIDYVEALHMHGVLPSGDDERGNPDQGGGCVRWGRRLYAWDSIGFAYCKRYETEAEAIEVSHDLWPLTFDELCADIEAHPLVERLQAGFGMELVTCDRPAEQLTNLLDLTFRACEALAVVAHDWGHYRLAAAVRQTVTFGQGTELDLSWLDDKDDRAPLTEAEAMAHAEALALLDWEQADSFCTRWLIGSHFYREDAEAEALAFLQLLNRADSQARVEGVEL